MTWPVRDFEASSQWGSKPDGRPSKIVKCETHGQARERGGKVRFCSKEEPQKKDTLEYMIRIRYHVQNGFKIAKQAEGFYPTPTEGKETEFDVQQSKHSQLASQNTAFIGVLDNIKKLVNAAETLFGDILGEVNALSERIALCKQSTEWCEQEMDTIIKAAKSGYSFQTNFRKEEKLKFDSEHGLFTPESMPAGYAIQIKQCEDIPPLQLLDNDPLNEDGQQYNIASFRENYSDPFGIYKKWLETQQRNAQRKVNQRKEKKKKKKKVEARKLQKEVTEVKLKRLQYTFVGQKAEKRDAKKGGGKQSTGASSKASDTAQKLKALKKQQQKEEKKKRKQQKKKNKKGGGSDAPPPPGMDDFGKKSGGDDQGDEEDDYSDDDDDDSDDDGPPPAPDAPDLSELNLGGVKVSNTKAGKMKAQLREEKKEVVDIFAQIRSGGFALKKVGKFDKPPPVISERDTVLKSIRRFDKSVLKDSSKRVLADRKNESKKRAPMNVGEILQKQLAMISQSGIDDDDDMDDDDDWDDDDDDEW